MISSSSDSCTKLVAGKYDVLLHQEEDPNLISKTLNGFLDRFERLELELQKQNLFASSSSSELSKNRIYPITNTDQQQNDTDKTIKTNVDQLVSEYSKEFKQLRELSRLLKLNEDNLRQGELEINQRKNRYQDILPFEHTRVILNTMPDISSSDYINANFIKGSSGSPKAYIACQGPLKRTLNDFWRMIWECNVSVVIMACNQYESGQLKCEVYWPEIPNTSLYYGCIKVTLIKVRQICDDFLIRKFSVKLMKPVKHNNKRKSDDEVISDNNGKMTATTTDTSSSCSTIGSSNSSCIGSDDGGCINHGDRITRSDGDSDHSYHHHQHQLSSNKKDSLKDCQKMEVLEERTICQFHYRTWPDHGVPQSVQPILELLRLVRDVQPAEDKPILVHCSAGCGRTGTICCIDYVWGLLRRCRLEPDFDLYQIISEMRRQRMSMVQTLEQYILCHRAVAALFRDQLNTMLDLDDDDGDDYDIKIYDTNSNTADELEKINTSEDDTSIPEKLPLDVDQKEEENIYYDDDRAFDYDDEDYGPVFI